MGSPFVVPPMLDLIPFSGSESREFGGDGRAGFDLASKQENWYAKNDDSGFGQANTCLHAT